MNRTAERSIISVIMSILLLIPVAAGAAVPLPVSLLAGESDGPVRLVLSAPEVKKLSQFDETRTEHLNRLIRHLAIDMNLDQDLSKTGILIDQDEVFSYLQREDERETQRIYSFEPSTIYTENKAIAENSSDDISAFLDEILSRSSRYMDLFYEFFASTPDIYADRVRKEGTELRFSGFGRAVQRVTISFPANYVEENFPGALADAAESEECRTIIAGLVFSGSQKICLLYDEAGNIVRINYDGKVGKTPETMRKVALGWKCLREENHQKDSISLKTPSVIGADKDNIALDRDLDSTGGHAGKYSWDIQIDHKAGKDDKKLTHFSAELTKDDSLISGKIAYNVKRDGKTTKVEIIPELQEESAGEYKGALEIADYSGKIEKNRATVHVQLVKGDPVNWPDTGMKRIGEGQPEQKEENGGQKDPESVIAETIIRKLFDLPEEDLAYFSNGIPSDLWLELTR